MFLTSRGIIKRRLAKAAADAQQAGAKIDGAAEQVETAAGDAKRTLAERARADFLAGYDRFMAALQDLDAHVDGAAAAVLKGVDRPFEDIGKALDRAQHDLEAGEAAAHEAQHADDSAARKETAGAPPL